MKNCFQVDGELNLGAAERHIHKCGGDCLNFDANGTMA